MEKKPDGGGPVVILAAFSMVLRCALPVLLLSGGLGAATAWFLEGSVIWLLLAGALAVAAGGLFLKLRSGANKQDDFRLPAAATTESNERSVAAGNPHAPEAAAPRPGNRQTVFLEIEGMTCDRCSHSVRRALERVPGVTQARVSLEEGIATVTHDADGVAREHMLEPVRQLGFVPSVAAAEETTGRPRNSAIILPSGFARASFHVEDLYEAADLASARKRIEALPGVCEAGAHRRSNGARAAVVWAIYDPRDLHEEGIAAAVRGMGFTMADTEEDTLWAVAAGS